MISGKDQIINILDFEPHLFLSQIHNSADGAPAIDNMQMNGRDCVPIKLYLQKLVVGRMWLVGHSLRSLV